MDSHTLAKILLEQPNMPVATHANNHVYMSRTDLDTHGKVNIGVLKNYSGVDHVLIGNFSRKDLNPPNWYVGEMIHGKLD